MDNQDFRRGDVLFTLSTRETTNAMRKTITLAQKLGSINGLGEANAVHASIVIATYNDRPPLVAEAVGGGLRASPVELGIYSVFRCCDGQLASFAADCAEGCVAIRDGNFGGASYGKYNTGRAALSPFKKLGGERETSAKSLFSNVKSSFYCSNFVYLAYASAAEILGLQFVPIARGREQIGPRDLMGAFIYQAASWENLGLYETLQ